LDGKWLGPHGYTLNGEPITDGPANLLRVCLFWAMLAWNNEDGTVETRPLRRVGQQSHVGVFCAWRDLKKQHVAALKVPGVVTFALYTFRHTCITRGGRNIWIRTLHVLAGHTDMNTTKGACTRAIRAFWKQW
jgi:hypothetical protein